ncbi:hypothetical protein T492DRAFT_462927 [Pavlovales sp. CCMP2436]|nr:hypothetical protein T492DRAFT_462927 [Pavlovales sp. CCMP2436]
MPPRALTSPATLLGSSGVSRRLQPLPVLFRWYRAPPGLGVALAARGALHRDVARAAQAARWRRAQRRDATCDVSIASAQSTHRQLDGVNAPDFPLGVSALSIRRAARRGPRCERRLLLVRGRLRGRVEVPTRKPVLLIICESGSLREQVEAR